MSLERLIRDHDEIDRLGRELLRLVRQEQPDPSAASTILAQLAGEVDAHLEYEDRTVYSVLIARYKALPFAGADRFEQLFEELRDSWCAYLAEWNDENVRADWGSFRTPTAEMIPRLQARVRTETSLVYALALSDSTIKLRDPQ